MHITFFIGNGFDLNIGLQTRYVDFLQKFYLLEVNDDGRIQKFKKHIDKNLNAWSDAEKMIGEYSVEFSDVNKDDYFFCFNDFCEKLCCYFRQEEKRIDLVAHKNKIEDVFKKSIVDFTAYMRPAQRDVVQSTMNSQANGSWVYNFINFNYTSAFDKCLKILKEKPSAFSTHRHQSATHTDSIGRLLHIHGTFDENMIMGVDNESQISNFKFRQDENLKKESSNQM